MPTFRDDLHLGHSIPMVDTEDIVDGAVTEPKLADDSVSTRTIQDGAVTEPKIAEKAVTEPKLADAAVSTRTIKFRAVTESKIGDSAVSTRTIQNGAVTNPKIANGAVSMNKLDNETQTLIQRGADSSWTPMGDYDVDALYDANDLVFDPETNSSYLSLRADNMGHAVTDETWWMKVVDGSVAEEAAEVANEAAQAANTAAANAEAKIDWVEEQVDSLVAYEVDDELDEESIIPVQNKVVTDAVVLQEAPDLTKYPTLSGYINSSQRWTSDSTGKIKTTYIRVFKGERYKIYAQDSGNFYAVLKSFQTSASATPQFATGYSGRIEISMGTTIILDVTPDDAMWLAVRNDNPETGSLFAPIIERMDVAKNGIDENKEEINTINDELYYDDPIAMSSLSYRSYVITAYNMWSSSTSNRNHFLVPVEAGQRYKIEADTFQCFYAFLKSNTIAAETAPDFCYGYEQRFAVKSNINAVVTIPADCNFLYLSRTNVSSDSPKALYIQKGLNNVGLQQLKKRVYGDDGQYYYYGERVLLTDKPMYSFSLWWDMSQNKCQSAASFGNYLFKVQDFNGSAPRIVMYNLSTKLQVAIKEMAHRSEGWVHCNQSSFGTQYYDESDPFPLLYISQQEVDENGNTASWATSKNKNMRSVCEVYRLIPTMGENDYNALDVVKVQTIYMPVITATNGLGRMNIGFDLQNNLMYAQSRDIANGDSNNYGLSYISLFKTIPPLRDDNDNIVENVYLTEADVRYTFPIYELGGDAQGNCIYNGKMYIARGSATARAQLYIVNLVTKKFLARLDLGVNGFNYEPEGVFIYDDNLYIVNVKVSLIELK